MRNFAIEIYQLCVTNIHTKCSLDCLKIRTMPVARNLYAIS